MRHLQDQADAGRSEREGSAAEAVATPERDKELERLLDELGALRIAKREFPENEACRLRYDETRNAIRAAFQRLQRENEELRAEIGWLEIEHQRSRRG